MLTIVTGEGDFVMLTTQDPSRSRIQLPTTSRRRSIELASTAAASAFVGAGRSIQASKAAPADLAVSARLVVASTVESDGILVATTVTLGEP